MHLSLSRIESQLTVLCGKPIINALCSAVFLFPEFKCKSNRIHTLNEFEICFKKTLKDFKLEIKLVRDIIFLIS